MSRYRVRSKAPKRKPSKRRSKRSSSTQGRRHLHRARSGGGLSLLSRFSSQGRKVAPEQRNSELEIRIAEGARRLQYILDRNQITRQVYQDTLRRLSNQRYGNADYDTLNQTQENWHNNITRRLFWEAWDWTDVRALYILFLRGLLPSVPTHIGPLVLDSQTQKDQLERINTLGFLSVDSQPGICEESSRQRAYLEGYIDSSVCDASRLYRYLTEGAAVIVTMTDSQGKVTSNIRDITRTWSRMPVQSRKQEDWGQTQTVNTTPAAPSDTQLWQKDGSEMLPLTPERLEDGTWQLYTNASFNYLLDPSSRNNVLKDLASYSPLMSPDFAKKLVYMQLQHTRFCKADLIDIVDKALQRAAA